MMRFPLALLCSIVCAALLCSLPSPARCQSATTDSDVVVMPSSYVLAPGDVLDITVQGFPDFTRETTIPPDGFITYVGVGQIQAAGQTRAQLTHALAVRLVHQIRHPQVTVSVRETHPRQISILGQGVRNPGVYNWRPGLLLSEAIASSGGPVQAPELTDATLATNHGKTNTTIDLVKLIEQGDPAQNVALQPGDTIFMSPRDPARAFVQVIGQVAHPGPFAVPPGGATIEYVLTQAGGATLTAALSRVQLQHDAQTQMLNLHPLLFDLNAPAGQTKVVAGDVVNVPLNNNHVDVFGEVNIPGELALPDGEPLSVTRALALRGGPTRDADQRTVGIVRTDAQGKQIALVVNTDDLLKARGKGQDIVLEPGDTLVVPKRRPGLNGLSALSTTLGTIFPLAALRTVFNH